MGGTARYKTKDILEKTGISRQTLQQYTTMRLVKEQERTPGGHRVFGKDAVKRIRLIRKLNRSGYTLRDIREVFKSGIS